MGIPNVVGTLGPYRSLASGVNAIPPGGTLNINGTAGIYHTGGVVTFTKPMTWKTYNTPTNIAP